MKSIIESLGCDQLYAKLGEAVLPLVKEFYENLKGMINDSLCKGAVDRLEQSSFEQLTWPPDQDDEEYMLLEEGVDSDKLKELLCQEEKEVIWKKGENNQFLRT